MTPFERRSNAYIQRMADDMRIRNFVASTIDSYTYHVDKFCSHFGQPAEQLTLEHIRDDQLYLVNEKQVSWSSFNQAVCALRFLYEVSLGKPWMIRHIPFGKRPKKLPVVLSDQEASQLIECVPQLKHRMVLLTCYAAGLRVSEATLLRIPDIDGQRQQIRGVSPHTLRHSFATGLLEAGVDLLTISKLLGHSSFITTMVYLHVRRQHFDRSPSPIDWLPVRQCPQWAERLPEPKTECDSGVNQQPPTEDRSAPASHEATSDEARQPPETQRRSSGRPAPAKRNRRRRA